MEDDYHYALHNVKDWTTPRVGVSSPVEFHAGLLAKVAQKCPNLKTLSLVQCLMGSVEEDAEEGEDHAANESDESDNRAPFKSLENLNLKWCEAGGEEFEGSHWDEWVKFLSSHTPSLRSLSLVDCFDGECGM